MLTIFNSALDREKKATSDPEINAEKISKSDIKINLKITSSDSE